MTTPQDPNQPVDPNEPVPPTPPVDPNQPYGQPAQYGTPQYGAPQPGAPQYGQPQYGAGQPGAPYGAPMPPPGEQPPSKGMAIGALVLAILGCIGITWIVSVVLAIIVLVKGKDGRNHGKGLAIAALIIDALYFLGLIVFVVLAVVVGLNSTTVDDLKTGDCISAKGLASSGDTIDSLDTVSCTSSHDGEVLATKTLTQDDADGYDSSAANSLCFDAITAAGSSETLSTFVASGGNVIGLTTSLDPSAGDKLACVGFNEDGSKLTKPIG